MLGPGRSRRREHWSITVFATILSELRGPREENPQKGISSV
jgi:hypothetical protein